MSTSGHVSLPPFGITREHCRTIAYNLRMDAELAARGIADAGSEAGARAAADKALALTLGALEMERRAKT